MISSPASIIVCEYGKAPYYHRYSTCVRSIFLLQSHRHKAYLGPNCDSDNDIKQIRFHFSSQFLLSFHSIRPKSMNTSKIQKMFINLENHAVLLEFLWTFLRFYGDVSSCKVFRHNKHDCFRH